MFTNEDEGFQALFHRLLAYKSKKQPVKMNESKRQTRTLSDGCGCADKRNVERKKRQQMSCWLRKGNKGQNQVSDVHCWNCGKSGHSASDCRKKWSGDKGSGKSKGGKGKVGKGKVKGKGKGNLNCFEWARRMVGSRNVTSRTKSEAWRRMVEGKACRRMVDR